MRTWYVAFTNCRHTVMRLVKDRSEAIALACEMLDRGIDVTGAGPMLETERQDIDPVTIRQIWRDRALDFRARRRPPVAEDAARLALMSKMSSAGQVAIEGGD
jgi:hypothetical protein